MSSSVVLHPVVSALVKAETILGPNRSWNATNNTLQQQFLASFWDACRSDLSEISELESMASWRAEEVKKFLLDHGYDFDIQPFPSDTFGVASVFDWLGEWNVEGSSQPLLARNGHSYDGVLIDGGVGFYTVPGHSKPVVSIATKGNETVYMTVMDRELTGFDLYSVSEQFSLHKQADHRWGDVLFPMITYDQKVDVSWLCDMWTVTNTGQRARIVEAIQQNKLRMNAKGVHAESGFFAAIQLEMACMPRPTLFIDAPFLFWIERDGLSKPLFTARFTQEDWRNPGEL